jgi:hypothetical protein
MMPYDAMVVSLGETGASGSDEFFLECCRQTLFFFIFNNPDNW